MKPSAGYATPLLLLLLVAQTQTVSFTLTSTSTSPNTARSTNSQYLMQMSATTTFATDFDITVSFTNAFTLSTLSACSVSLNGNSLASAQCNRNGNSIVFSSLGIASTVSTLSLAFTT